MVKWKVESHNSDFLPRFSAPIRQIKVAPDCHNICLIHCDNTISLVDSSKVIRHSLNSFSRQWLERPYFPVGFVRGFSDDVLMTNGNIGHVQFFGVRSGKPFPQIDVARQNYVIPVDGETECCFPSVTSAVFVKDWLITADYNKHISLVKFWKYSQKFELSFFVDENDKVESILSGDCMICICFNKTIQIWRLYDDWVATGSINSDFPVSNFRISVDSSVLLGVVHKPQHDQVVTWDLGDLSIFPQMGCFSQFKRIRQIEFCGGQSQRLVVVVTKEGELSLVDMLGGGIVFSFCGVSLVATNKQFDFVAIFNGDVELLDTLTMVRTVLMRGVDVSHAALFDVGTWILVFLHGDQNLTKISPLDDQEEEEVVEEGQTGGVLADFLMDVEEVRTVVSSHVDRTRIGEYFMTFSSHMLPPVDVMCRQFFDELIGGDCNM